MNTTAIWILASIFASIAVPLAQTDHLTLSIIFGTLSVAMLVISLFVPSKESNKVIDSKCPVNKLTIVDFAGVKGEATIKFESLTLFYGTSKLNQTIGELLNIFSDRKKFEQTRQPRSGVSSWNYGNFPITEETKVVLSVSRKEPRYFSPAGKLQLYLSDGKQYIIRSTIENAEIFLEDAPLPVFSSVLNIITIGTNFESIALSGDPEDELAEIEGISSFFGVSATEVRNCIQGVASDRSLFNYDYKLENNSKLLVKLRDDRHFFSIRNLSSGELKRFVLDMAIRIATYSARVRPTVMTVDQSHISSLDAEGWANFLEWIEKFRPPFQVVVDCCRRPSEGELFHALCYDAVGTDMAVTSFEQRTWAEFKNPITQELSR
jgi:hypothetical protein